MRPKKLIWLTLVTDQDPRFKIAGTELAFFTCGPDGRFSIAAVRQWHGAIAARSYVIRDRDTVTHEQIRCGERPDIVKRVDSLEEALAFCCDGVEETACAA